MIMPPYPIIRASVSRVIIFGVVPDATSEWNPEIAPHAMVMKREREQLAGEDRALTRGRKRRERRHPQWRQNDQDRDGEHQHRRDLEEGREVVAGTEQHPHRQHRRDEAVGDHHPGERRAALRERRRKRGMTRHAAAADQRDQQQQRTDDRRLAHFPGTPALHPPAHQQRDGNGARNREESPRRRAQRVHHDQRQDREQDDHDREHGDHRRHTRDFADLLLGHLTERLTVATQRAKEDGEVLHRAAEHHADDEPQRPGEETELRREHRADERSRPRDGGEVMAEQHPLVRGHEVTAVVEALRRCGALGIEAEDARGEEFRVEAVGDDVRTDGGRQQPGGADRFTAGQGEHAECGRAQYGNGYPDDRPHGP